MKYSIRNLPGGDLNDPKFYEKFLTPEQRGYSKAATLLVYKKRQVLVGTRTKKDILEGMDLPPMGRGGKDVAEPFLKYYLENGPDGSYQPTQEEIEFLDSVQRSVRSGEELSPRITALVETREEAYLNFMHRLHEVQYFGTCVDPYFGYHDQKRGLWVATPFRMDAFRIEHKGEERKEAPLKEYPELLNLRFMSAKKLSRRKNTSPLVRIIAQGFIDTLGRPGTRFHAVVEPKDWPRGPYARK